MLVVVRYSDVCLKSSGVYDEFRDVGGYILNKIICRGFMVKKPF